MSSAAQRKATFDELYAAIQALPEGITGEILMDGQIETMGRPGRLHAWFCSELLRRLRDLEYDPKSGWVFDWERDLRVTRDRLVVPDVAGWRVPDGDTSFLDENPVRRVPDWSCEILSDSTAKKDREEKLPLYLGAGVGHVWLVDTERRKVEVFVAGDDGAPVRVALATGDTVVSLAPFDGWPIALAPLWVPGRR